jgi:4-amino-4-deoxy-L-arabinose transferase-like glycosyltransferase
VTAKYPHPLTHASADVPVTFFASIGWLPTARRSLSTPLAVSLIVLAAVVARCFTLLTTSIDADEGVYLVMAQQWLQGGLPYVAVWDQHPPGLPALLAVVLTVVPDPILGARLAGGAAVLSTALLLYRFCTRYASDNTSGLIAALLYILCISRWAGLSTNTEIFNNFCVTFAVYHLFGAIRHPPSLWRAAAASLALGIGLQIKYVVFPESVLLCLAYLFALFRRTSNPVATVGTGAMMIIAGCLPSALATLYFWQQGALAPFIEANIGANLTYVGLLPSVSDLLRDSASGLLPIVGAVVIIVFAIARCAAWRLHRADPLSMQMWVLLWILATALDVCLPMKFFRHYFFALYPPVCVAGALALAAVVAGRRKWFAYGLVILLATSLPMWGMGMLRAAPWSAEDVPRLVADTVLSAGATDGDLYVYRYQPSVYALTRIRPPTPYVMTLELSEFSQSAHVDGVAEINRILANQPRFIVKPAVAVGGLAAPVDEVLARYLVSYRLVGQFTDEADRSVIQLFER